jgi:tetratricopeptide (TPR) repeat protein
MEEITLKDLDPRLQKQVGNARKAMDKNPTYAVDILLNIVNRNPACLEARKILRQAQQRAAGGKAHGLGKLLNKMTNIPFAMGSGSKVKKDPANAMESAETMLSSNPESIVAHKMLGAGADALELFSTAAFAYEQARKLDPDNLEIIKGLMLAYIKTGKSEEAIRIGDAVYRQNPTADEIQELIKKASVEHSINKGKWEGGESFRDKLKDEDESNKLEQAGRSKTGESGLRAQIEDAKKAVEEEPGNINFYRDISSNYRKIGEYEQALEWIRKARQLEAGRSDVNLERLESTLKREQMAQAIADNEAEFEANPESAVAEAALGKSRVEERAFRLASAKDLVQRYPNEFSYRYELGELYFEDGENDMAIKELQLAQRSAKVRIDSLILLGKAYKVKGFFDLAAEQLSVAKAEIPGVTEQKKDVLYELGACYEQQGEIEKAMVEFKALYGADISFRDVAQKIDDFYSKK